MAGVERGLLMAYLPILAPLVLLTLFVWPWKILGHSFRGLVKSISHTWRGYSRSSGSHRRRAFSFWRNVFLGSWMELARQREAQLGGSLAAAPPDGGLEPAYADTLLQAADQTRARLLAELRASLLKFGVMAGFLFIVLVRPSHVPPSASAPVSSAGAGGAAVDLAGFCSGLGFLLALAFAGVCAQLASLLGWTATPQQLYWFILTWERALSGRQLASAAVVVLALAAGLAAAYQLYAPWVFILLLFTGATAFYAYMYLWADSMWCPYQGAYVHLSQSYHREVLGVEVLPVRPSRWAFWQLEPMLEEDVPGSAYDRMHRHLWRESQAGYYASSSGDGTPHGAAAGNGTRATVQLGGGGRWGKQRSGSGPLAIAAGGGPAPLQEGRFEHSSSWPFMRYNGNGAAPPSNGSADAAAAAGSGGSSKSLGRLKKAASGLQAVSEAGGTYPAAASAGGSSAAARSSLPL